MSVIASECRYCLRVALVTASGTVWSLPPVISSSGPRVVVVGVDLGRRVRVEVGGGGLEQRLARRGDRPALVQLVGLLRRDGVAEGEAELLGGERDGPVLVGRVLEDRAGSTRSADSGSGSTPLICAASIAMAAARQVLARAASGRSCRRRSGRSGSAWRRQRVDERRVVRDDVVDAVVGDARRGLRGPPRRVSRVARPAGGRRRRSRRSRNSSIQGPRRWRAATGRG